MALRRPLGPDEMLAVTYVSATGDTIGTYNPERVYNAGRRPRLELLKASNANHRPGLPTWDQEMHQVYRVSSSPDVDPSSVGLSISLGELSAGRTFTRDLAGRDVTFLRLLGLDEESPVDVLDPGGLYRATDEFLQERPVIPGVFIVFPTLRPFQSPRLYRCSASPRRKRRRFSGPMGIRRSTRPKIPSFGRAAVSTA